MAPATPTVIRPAGREAVLFNDDLFAQLRRLARVPDDFVNEGWGLDSLENGGGKGGCLMAFLGSEYVVKELSSGDHHALLALAKSYANHVRRGKTLLGLVLLHFEDCASKRRFYAMRNVVGRGPFLAMYDLKGCNDDKTLELFGESVNTPRWFWGTGCLCGTSDAIRKQKEVYGSGKMAAARADLEVTAEQRADIIQRLRRDTQWLAGHDLMDYSLLVAVKSEQGSMAGEALANCLGRLPLARSCADGSLVVVCVGIIDFLQRWTAKKMAAQAIKCLERNRATIPPASYAARFCRHFEERFVVAVRPRSRGASAGDVPIGSASEANVQSEITADAGAGTGPDALPVVAAGAQADPVASNLQGTPVAAVEATPVAVEIAPASIEVALVATVSDRAAGDGACADAVVANVNDTPTAAAEATDDAPAVWESSRGDTAGDSADAAVAHVHGTPATAI